jgi:hypothetical protein
MFEKPFAKPKGKCIIMAKGSKHNVKKLEKPFAKPKRKSHLVPPKANLFPQ